VPVRALRHGGFFVEHESQNLTEFERGAMAESVLAAVRKAQLGLVHVKLRSADAKPVQDANDKLLSVSSSGAVHRSRQPFEARDDSM